MAHPELPTREELNVTFPLMLRDRWRQRRMSFERPVEFVLPRRQGIAFQDVSLAVVAAATVSACVVILYGNWHLIIIVIVFVVLFLLLLLPFILFLFFLPLLPNLPQIIRDGLALSG